MNIGNIFKNVTPSVAVMVVGLLGAYLVYDNYFSKSVETADIASFEPAAGEEATEAVTESVVAVEGAATIESAVDAVEGTAEAVTQEAPICLMDDHGNPVMGEDGITCVPAPVEGAAIDAVEGVTEAVEGATEAVEGAVEGAMPEATPVAPAAH